MTQNVPGNLRHFRAVNGLTLQAVADSLEVSRATISQYEHGHRTPNVGRLSELARLYGVTLDQLTAKRW